MAKNHNKRLEALEKAAPAEQAQADGHGVNLFERIRLYEIDFARWAAGLPPLTMTVEQIREFYRVFPHLAPEIQ